MGFRIRETMSGHHEFALGQGPAGRHPFAFHIQWGPDRLLDWLNPLGEQFLWQEVQGEVEIGGLCERTPCTGTLSMEYFKLQRIRYTLDFELNSVSYRFIGEKSNIRPWNLATSHTTCFGTLVELGSGKLVSTSVTEFRMRDIPRFVASLRWV